MRRTAVLLLLAATACIEASPSELTDAVVGCAFGRAARLGVGASLSATGSTNFCIDAAQGGDFVLVPFFAAPPESESSATVSFTGRGLGDPPSDQELQLQAPQAGAAPAFAATDELARALRGTDAWHYALRERERIELDPLTRPRGPALHLDARATAPIRALASPAVGETMQLNVAASCTSFDLRTARVAAVTQRSIVAVDPDNPTNDPFTESDYEQFGRDFDDLVHPTITQAFGEETDLDGNGRVILYFTRAVNEIVPPGGGIGIAIGFFYRGDVFPRAGIPGRTAPCAGSNEGEVLFLAVPDPDGDVRGVPISYATMRQVMTGTIAHEFQHLINAARRLHVTNAPALEDTWLNEGLSYIAEELMFYATAGETPLQNIDTTAIYQSAERVAAFNRYMYFNLGRFDLFLQSAHEASPMGPDRQQTRGAAWSFLRYAADRDPRTDAELFRALAGGPATGLENLAAALGADPLEWMRDWSMSVFADDLVPDAAERFHQPSWNARNLISALRLIDRRYPLRLLPLESGAGFALELRAGAAAYTVFSVEPGQRAFVTIQVAGAGDGETVHSTLLRVR